MAENTVRKSGDKKPSIFVRIKNYFKDLVSETKKITWPTPKTILKNSIIVIVAVVVCSLILGGVNWALAWVSGKIVELLAGL